MTQKVEITLCKPYCICEKVLKLNLTILCEAYQQCSIYFCTLSLNLYYQKWLYDRNISDFLTLLGRYYSLITPKKMKKPRLSLMTTKKTKSSISTLKNMTIIPIFITHSIPLLLNPCWTSYIPY